MDARSRFHTERVGSNLNTVQEVGEHSIPWKHDSNLALLHGGTLVLVSASAYFIFYSTVDDALLYIFEELVLFPKDDIVTVMKISREWHFCSDSGFCDMACFPIFEFFRV